MTKGYFVLLLLMLYVFPSVYAVGFCEYKEFNLTISARDCPFECCKSIAYVEKACPSNRTKTYTQAMYTPEKYGLANGTTEQITAACVQIASKCWSTTEKTDVVALTCQSTSCVETGILISTTANNTLAAEPTPTQKETVIQTITQQNVSTGQIEIITQQQPKGISPYLFGGAIVAIAAVGYFIFTMKKSRFKW